MSNIYNKLKEYILELNERVDLDVYKLEIGEPVEQQKLVSYQHKLPDALLEFYSVMNGCCIDAWFNDKYEDSIKFCIPPIEKVGNFWKAENTIDEYNFKPGSSFLKFEDSTSDRPSYFVLENGETDCNKYIIISAWAGKENDYSLAISSLTEFIDISIKNCLVFTGFCNPEKEKHLLAAQKRVAKKIDKEPKAPKQFLPNENIEHPLLGIGTIVNVVNTGRIVEYYHPIWLLVHFYIPNCSIWVQMPKVRKRAKKPEFIEKAFMDPIAFFNYLKQCNICEKAMFLNMLSWGRHDRFGNNEITIPSTSKNLFGVFQNVELEIFLNWSFEYFRELNTSSIISCFLEDQSYIAKKGLFTISKQGIGWNFITSLEELLGCIVIYLIDESKEISEDICSKVDEIVVTVQEIITKIDSQRIESSELLNSIIQFLNTRSYATQAEPILYKGSQIKDSVLIEAGLKDEYSYHTE